jgi:tRNA(Ile2) C34 agmatinyltransferase TiaS
MTAIFIDVDFTVRYNITVLKPLEDYGTEDPEEIRKIVYDQAVEDPYLFLEESCVIGEPRVNVEKEKKSDHGDAFPRCPKCSTKMDASRCHWLYECPWCHEIIEVDDE